MRPGLSSWSCCRARRVSSHPESSSTRPRCGQVPRSIRAIGQDDPIRQRAHQPGSNLLQLVDLQIFAGVRLGDCSKDDLLVPQAMRLEHRVCHGSVGPPAYLVSEWPQKARADKPPNAIDRRVERGVLSLIERQLDLVAGHRHAQKLVVVVVFAYWLRPVHLDGAVACD
eukprot:5206355-Prymnesium_polylepis.2